MTFNLKKIIQGKLIPICVSLLLTGLTCWLISAKNPTVDTVLTRLDHVYYDLRLHYLPSKQNAKQLPIRIVDIDNKSLTLQGRWPWPRSLIAKLLEKLQHDGATVVAFDLLFAEPETNIADSVLSRLSSSSVQSLNLSSEITSLKQQFDSDSIFAKQLAQGETVLGYALAPKVQAPTSGQLPQALWTIQNTATAELSLFRMESAIGVVPQLLTAAKYGGFLSTSPDPDGVIRRTPLILRYQDKIYPSLALQATALYLLINQMTLEVHKIGDQNQLEGIQLGKDVIRTDQHGQVLIPFLGPTRSFVTVSATDVLNDKVDAKLFNNTLVFIGSSALGLGDLKPTPLQNLFPGVEVHASVAAGLLAKQFPYTPVWAKGVQISIIILLGLLISFIMPYLNALLLNLFGFTLIVALIASNFWFWQQQNLALDIMLPALLIFALWIFNLMYSFFSERSQRKELKSVFGQYVPSQHIDEMMKNPGSYGFEGESREMTVLFADIRDFTSVSEKLTVTQLKGLLNVFFTEITKVIFQHDGTIDKYVGDLVMAFWGAPLHNKSHAENALHAALQMQKICEQLQPQFKAMGTPPINIGIGLNTGVMNVGDMGSRFRRNYTVLGDAVNLASRLESLTKYYQLQILVTEATITQQHDVIYRYVDKLRVKGKQEAIKVFQPLLLRTEADPKLMESLENYQRGIDAFYKQEWQAALSIFSNLQQQFPEDPLYRLYLQRTQQYQSKPPTLDWDGVVSFTEK